MTTHDVHRSMEDSLFNNFQRHSIKSPTTASIASFRSMTTDLINLLPNSSFSRPQSSTRDRPTSDILQHHFQPTAAPQLTEAEVIDQWFENIQRYEQMLEDVAAASLDQTFKDELQHVNHWFQSRSDAERTAALYSVVQCASPIQVRFLIMVLQQLANQEPLESFLTNQDKDSIIGGPVPGSVVSTESEYERRKRQFYLQRHDIHQNRQPRTTHHSLKHSPPSMAASMHLPTASHTLSGLSAHGPSQKTHPGRITSASSEPDDHLRRNRTLFGRSSSSINTPSSSALLGHSVLSQQGMLVEKALAARAQIQAAYSGHQKQSSLDSLSTPSLAPSASSTTSSRTSPKQHPLNTRLPSHRPPTSSSSTTSNSSLFGTDWPFPLVRSNNNDQRSNGRIVGEHRSTLGDSLDWASVSSASKDMPPPPWASSKPSQPSKHKPLRSATSAHGNAIPTKLKENDSQVPSLYRSLNALEQAQARLRAADQQRALQQSQRQHSLLSSSPPSSASCDSLLRHPTDTKDHSQPRPSSSSSLSTSGLAMHQPPSPPYPHPLDNKHKEATPASSHNSSAMPVIITPTTSSNTRLSPRPSPSSSTAISARPSTSPVPLMSPSPSSSSNLLSPDPGSLPPGDPEPSPSLSASIVPRPSFSTQPTVYEDEILETSPTLQAFNDDDAEPALTGVARRRKRSSAARALKDKIAAETIDFDLMKDVQNWMRSLRLHKYGHAFEGLQWQQVIKMDDQDMLDAGVNTLGARRKLLKVFENVQRHCDENGIAY